MEQPNIVLIVMDTARSVDVGIKSGPATTPFLDSFAQCGTAFTSAQANSPWTLPSHATLFSGQLTNEHNTHAGNLTFDETATMAARLNDVGYMTLAISNNTWISPEFGFDTGFEEFLTTWKLYQEGADFGGVSQTRTGIKESLRGVMRAWEGDPVKNIANLLYGRFLRRRQDDGAQRTNQLVEKRLNDIQRPLFLFVNYLEPHLPYDPPDENVREWLPDNATVGEARAVNQDAWAYITGEKNMDARDFDLLRALYRGELTYLDERLAELHDLFDIETDRETVFFIVGDHGENIGDHGLMDHQYSLAETLLSIPLIAAGGPFDGGNVVETPVQIADLYPTILDVATNDAPGDLIGTTLCQTEGIDDERALFAEYVTPQPAIEALRERYDVTKDLSIYDRALQSVRRGPYKLVRGSDGSRLLYNLCKDPAGTQDMSEENPDAVETLDALLDSRLGPPEIAGRDARELNQGVTDRLEDLGYLR